MIRAILVLLVLGLILFGAAWALRWLARNRVRITMNRAPTGREILFISMALQLLKTLLRMLLKR